MNKRSIASLFLLSALLIASSFLLPSCKGGEEAEDTSISISGAFALYPLVNVWAEEFRKEHPEVRFSISGGGAGKGMADVLSGVADLGMFSREVTQAERDLGVWWVAVAKDAVIPTVSSNHPLLAQLKTEGLTKEELTGFFITGGAQKWKGSAQDVHVYTRSDAAGAADVWSKYLGGKTQEDLKGIAVFGDPGLADAVKNDPQGIGYNNVIYVYDLNSGQKYPGIEVAPIDINGNHAIDPEENFYGNLEEINKAIADGRYPSPPARPLYLVSKGQPTKKWAKAFLAWILNKGQAFVDENGYIVLPQEVLDAEKRKL